MFLLTWIPGCKLDLLKWSCPQVRPNPNLFYSFNKQRCWFYDSLNSAMCGIKHMQILPQSRIMISEQRQGEKLCCPEARVSRER